MSPSQDNAFLPISAMVLLLLMGFGGCQGKIEAEFPDGYFPFEESAARIPPKVRRPPYAQADVDCPGVGSSSVAVEVDDNAAPSLDNLCGDLNKGYLPRSPLRRNINGHSYPFELIRNKTLDFFSDTLPILKEDRNLPKVAKYEDFDVLKRRMLKSSTPVRTRTSRSDSADDQEPTPMKVHSRKSRALCEKNYGILCTIYKMVNGRFSGDDEGPQERREDAESVPSTSENHIGDEPLTPCPSAAEYVTPVYAKNYQGVWRYVVQIPYEGYFTQTVEVTKCLRKQCHFMDGSCLASPRWVSLLVAELFYPHARFPATKPGPSSRSMGNGKERRWKAPLHPPSVHPIPLRSSSSEQEDSASRRKRQLLDQSASTPATYCDGVDDIGCYQVRLYYDWFLVPGSCKCWRQDFFTKYGRR